MRTHRGDGWVGWQDAAPYDAILVTAATPEVPPRLLDQLAPGGRLVLPLGRPGSPQSLTLIKKDAAGAVTSRDVCRVRFLPLRRPADLD